MLYAKKKEIAISKEGPSLSCNLAQFYHLKTIKANMITLANNHIFDYGTQGLKNILDESKAIGIQTVGAGLDADSKTNIAYIYEENNSPIAIINCCESEFSVTDEKLPGANPLDEIEIYNNIHKAKKKAKAIIVIVHGGHEYYQLPSPRIQKTFRFFIDSGADIVVAHHPHCYSGYEHYKNGYIFYSLGNFFFNNNSSKRTIWNDGFLIELDITLNNKSINYKLHPYIQCHGNNKILLMNNEEKEIFYSHIKKLNAIIKDKQLLLNSFQDYAHKQEKNALARILPYNNHYLQALFKRSFLPSLLSKKAIISHLNAIRCESHKDLLIHALYKIYKNGEN